MWISEFFIAKFTNIFINKALRTKLVTLVTELSTDFWEKLTSYPQESIELSTKFNM